MGVKLEQKIILTYKPRGSDKSKEFIGSVTFGKNLVTFRGTERGVVKKETLILEKADLICVSSRQNKTTKFSGVMDGWPIEWMIRPWRT